MTSSPNEKINAHYCRVFYCYAREDDNLRRQLENHLSSLKRSYPFQTWFDGEIIAGDDWEKVIAKKIDEANMILLLISPDFLASEHCQKEMRRALDRCRDDQGQGHVKVIPILLRTADWKNTPLNHLKMLPEGAQPISSWEDRDKAFLSVVNGVEKIIIQAFHFHCTTADEWIEYGDAQFDAKDYGAALQASEQAIRLDPKSVRAYSLKGEVHFALSQLEEALTAYQKAKRLKRNNPHISGEIKRLKDMLEKQRESSRGESKTT